MTLADIEMNKNYIISSFRNLNEEEQKLFHNIGLSEGDIIFKKQKINTSKNICIFESENLSYSLNRKYAIKVMVLDYEK